MRIFPNGLEIVSTEYEILADTLVDADIERIIIIFISQKIEQAKKDFRDEWMKKLEDDPTVKSYPKKLDDFVKMVMAHPLYLKKKEDVLRANPDGSITYL